MRKVTGLVHGLLAAVLLLGGSGGALAGSGSATVPLDYLPALKGGYFPLQSRSADHLYHIYVRLPDGYEANPGRRYPAVYVLDGDSLFPLLGATHLFLTIDDKTPEAIIVGISYGSFDKPTNRRHIDFMPPTEGKPAQESGAAAFHRFMKSELIPAVERRYRADPARRILFGQSRGGAMVLYSAFTDPDLFWGRIASNPSFEPGGETWFGTAPRASRKDLRFVLASGTEEQPNRRESALRWFRHWENRTDAPWTLKGFDIQGGTHSAYSPDAYRSAIRWLFSQQTQKR